MNFVRGEGDCEDGDESGYEDEMQTKRKRRKEKMSWHDDEMVNFAHKRIELRFGTQVTVKVQLMVN